MARRRITLQRIAKNAARRATYKKRVQGLMKKAWELSTLCDVKVCILTYGEGAVQPEVWPSIAEVKPILERFRALTELEQCKQMLNQEGFLRKVIGKVQDQLQKSERETHELETTLLLNDAILGRRPGLIGLTIEELVRLSLMVERRLKHIKEQIEELHQHALTTQSQMKPVMVSSSPLPISYEYGNMCMNASMNEAQQKEGWLMDLVKSSGELGAIVYSGFKCDNGASTSTGGERKELSNNMGAGSPEVEAGYGPFGPYHPM